MNPSKLGKACLDGVLEKNEQGYPSVFRQKVGFKCRSADEELNVEKLTLSTQQDATNKELWETRDSAAKFLRLDVGGMGVSGPIFGSRRQSNPGLPCGAMLSLCLTPFNVRDT